jgi:hypothetical protein
MSSTAAAPRSVIGGASDLQLCERFPHTTEVVHNAITETIERYEPLGEPVLAKPVNRNAYCQRSFMLAAANTRGGQLRGVRRGRPKARGLIDMRNFFHVRTPGLGRACLSWCLQRTRY